jgi:hypothetical protein
MKANEFCYWLQGYFEIGDAAGVQRLGLPMPAVDTIKAHLALVAKADPDHARLTSANVAL